MDTVAGDVRVQARQQHAQGLCRRCQECSLVTVCGGGYLPHRYSGGENFANPSVYCADLMKIINHIRKRVLQEVRKGKPGTRHRQPAVATTHPATPASNQAMRLRVKPGAKSSVSLIGRGAHLMDALFELTREAETALGLRRGCQYALLNDRMEAAGVLHVPGQGNP